MNTKVIKRKGVEELRTDQLAIDTRETKSKLLFYGAMGILGLTVASLAVFLYWTIQMGTVLEIKNAPVPVRPKIIDKSQYVLLHYNYCKHTNSEGLVESQLISKTSVLVLPDAVDSTKKACHEFDAPYPIPGQTAPETYHYHFKACYPINPVKKVCTEWDSKPFTIEGPKPEIEIQIPKN
jgi:hypothetical protein